MTTKDKSPDTLRSQGVAAVQAMQKVRRVKYDRLGPQAILASVYGQEFELVTPPGNTVANGVAVVMIMGPLTHRGGGWWDCGDTYDGIEARVKAAIESSAATIVLKIDSPGGDVSGCFECSKTLRQMAAAAGKKLVAYVDETAASGAYALACAADAIYLPPSARVGSIGVITMIEDATGADAQQGYKYTVFTSGARKADGCPHLPMSPEAAAEFQRQVDSWALMFATLVADSRKVAVAEIQRLEAGIFQGADALRVKLADGVMGWDSLLAMLAGGQAASTPPAPPDGGTAGENDMKRSELIAALKAALAEEEPAPAPEKKEGDGGDMSKADLVAALKKALAEDAPPPSEQEPPPAPAEDGEAKAKTIAQAAAQANRTQAAASDPVVQALAAAQQAKAETAQLRAEMQAKEDAAALKALLDTRPDLDGKARAFFEKKPLAYVKEALEFIPRAPVNVNPAAAAMAQPALGADRGPQSGAAIRTSEMDPKDVLKMRAAMGIEVQQETLRWDGNDRVFPTQMNKAEAEALLKANEAALKASNERLALILKGGVQ